MSGNGHQHRSIQLMHSCTTCSPTPPAGITVAEYEVSTNGGIWIKLILFLTICGPTQNDGVGRYIEPTGNTGSLARGGFLMPEITAGIFDATLK